MSEAPTAEPPGPVSARPPSVDSLARSLADIGLPHALLVDAARAAIASGEPSSARRFAVESARRLLGPVINATGVLLHTNLGRAPLGPPPAATATRYANLELDMDNGRRGSRSSHVASLIERATGAEAALVVNNGAAAVFLVLAALAPGAGVVVSRGELIEIGGGFRIPEVLAASGARLVEVGTTNRTRRDDYAAALSDDIALILKVHRSNFAMTGFVESAEVSELSTLDRPVVVDLGSGLLDERCPWLPAGPPTWLTSEPGVRQTLGRGADLVTFSGDKLLGGPQAGIIVGRSELVERCARHPLSRALRPGGLVLAALQQTLLAYLEGDATVLPFWDMAIRTVGGLRQRAEALGVGAPIETTSVVGGGALPEVGIPSYGVVLRGEHAATLRSFEPPVIATVSDDDTVCDLRTVDPSDDPLLAEALRACT